MTYSKSFAVFYLFSTLSVAMYFNLLNDGDIEETVSALI